MNVVWNKERTMAFKPRGVGTPAHDDWFVPQMEHELIAVKFVQGKHTTHERPRILLEPLPVKIVEQWFVSVSGVNHKYLDIGQALACAQRLLESGQYPKVTIEKKTEVTLP